MTKTAQKYVGARYLKRSHGKDNWHKYYYQVFNF
jgi:hypothetical protein